MLLGALVIFGWGLQIPPPHPGPLPTTHPPKETSSAHFASQTAFIGHLALYCTQEGGGCHLEQGPSVGGAANDAT